MLRMFVAPTVLLSGDLGPDEIVFLHKRWVAIRFDFYKELMLLLDLIYTDLPAYFR